MGGNGRLLMSAFTLAAGGNVTGSASQLLQSTVVNTLQGLGAQQIKLLADSLNSETARTALQGLLAGTGAAIQGQNVIPAALGASGSVVLNNLFEAAYGENSQDLTLDKRQARRNLVTSIISGTTQALGGDAILANTAAILEMENNYLSQKQEIQKNQELANCPNVIDKTAKEIKWLLVSAGQNGSVVVGVIAGTPVALVEVGCDIAQAVRHPIDTCSGLKKLLGSWESLCDFPQLLEQALDAQYNKMTHELERAGIAGSFKGGIEAARLGMDVTLLGGSVRSVLNAGKSLTGTSIKLSINSAEMVKTFGLPGAIKTGVQSTANAAKSTINNVSSGVSQTVKQTVKVAQALVKSSAAKQASSVAEKGAQCFKKVSKSSSGVSTHSHVPRKNLSTSLSRSEKAIGKNSFAAINTSEKPIEGISFPLDFSSNIVIEDSVFKFNKIESKIISEAKCILNSPEISKIKNAHGTGKPITIKIGNRIIQYEPSLPASGMTMFGDNGFLIGNEAFTSIQEFRKTILHELYRLQTSKSSSGVSKTLAAQETKSAADFASNAVSALESIK